MRGHKLSAAEAERLLRVTEVRAMQPEPTNEALRNRYNCSAQYARKLLHDSRPGRSIDDFNRGHKLFRGAP